MTNGRRLPARSGRASYGTAGTFGISHGHRDGKGTQGKDSRQRAERSYGTIRDDTVLQDILEMIKGYKSVQSATPLF